MTKRAADAAEAETLWPDAEGLRAVAVFSDADADALHVRLADAAVHIGSPAPTESYLSIRNLIAAAKASEIGRAHV